MREAIDSALAQTWPDTQVLVVNDGSRDGGETNRIVRSYGGRIRYIEKPNGVAHAERRYIFCWLSHDDRHLPHKTERPVDGWCELGCSEAVLYCDYRLSDAHGHPPQDVRRDHEMLVQKPLYAVLRGCVHGCSVFVPRSRRAAILLPSVRTGAQSCQKFPY